MSTEATIDGIRQYCGCCYGDAAKAGRIVRKVDCYDYPLCPVCETRMRNGLIHYRPSNGTEFHIFADRCYRCRHFNADGMIDGSVSACAWGVLNKLLNAMWQNYDDACNWQDPEDIADGCPATCKRYTPKDDEMGHFRDPPPKDCIGQMVLGESLAVEKPELQHTSEGAK